MTALRFIWKMITFIMFSLTLIAVNSIIAIGIFIILNQAFYTRVNVWDYVLFATSVPIINIVGWEIYRYLYVDNE